MTLALSGGCSAGMSHVVTSFEGRDGEGGMKGTI